MRRARMHRCCSWLNGTKWIYSYDLLQRRWNQAFALPEGNNAIAIKRIGTQTLVLDRSGDRLWIHTDGQDSSKQIPIPRSSGDLPTQIASVGANLVLASRKALWVIGVDSIVDTPHKLGSKTNIAWNNLAPPAGEQIVQVSADSAYLYCSTDSGSTFRILGSELGVVKVPAPWFVFDPSSSLTMEHEPIRRLRWVDGELLAFSADGVSHSRNLGLSWQRETTVADQPVRLDEVEQSGNLYAVTRTALLKATPEEAKRMQWHAIKQLDDGCIASQAREQPSDSRSLLSINTHDLAIVTTEPGNPSQGICLFDIVTGNLSQLSSGWQPSNIPISLAAIDEHLIVGSDRGLTFWDSKDGRWTAPAETSPFDGSPPNGRVTAVARYGTHGVILATESRSIYYRESWSVDHPWKRVSDKFDSVVNNLQNGNAKITFIWVNPRRLSEIYLVMNQVANINFYYRDRADTMFILNPIGGDRATGLIEDETGDLWITGVNNSYYINRNRPVIGSWEDFNQRFQDQAAARLSQPITWVSGILTSYIIAVLCVLALRFLPVSPVLGRSWLASLVVKPFTVSPILGRWILFLGYKVKIRKEMLAEGLYLGLPALMPDGVTIPPDEGGQFLCETVLSHAAQNNSVLVTGRPGSGKSMLLARLAYTAALENSGGKKLLPILVTADEYSGDLIESASKILKERYGIPLDTEDILIGQMQVGGILFLFDGLSEVSISRSAAVADLLQVTRMPEFRRCSLIISARPFEGQPEIPTCQILPVRAEDAIMLYLPRFKLPPEEHRQIEASLRAFRDEPVDVQLLTMTIESRGKNSFQRRYEIFRAFFQKRLGAEDADGAERWAGWNFALENLAKWFCLDTGVKSVGLSQRATVDAMESIVSVDGAPDSPRNLLSELRDTFNIELTTSAALLNYLRTSGILVRLDRWKFAHDSFEEFFCASYLAGIAVRERHLPNLGLWRTRPEEFVEVFSFLSEMLDLECRISISQQGELPAIWRDRLAIDQ